ncbi:uncharacterized protein LOC118733502 [Rhagoletis pomonella]|uniref:uncharacterized protein LOC118733502 n=1 Tax=Rhagoletis pomonella TaxID=28610 RepID=UPI00177D23FC|nr:uncharacterized protein LOC118733502 [Rhagoletis pomonella]
MPLNDSHLVSAGHNSDANLLDISGSTPRLPLPTMSEDNIEAYFYSLDFWFDASSVTSDTRKFNIVLASVSPTKLMELRPTIEAAPISGKYNYIQQKLIEHFSDSQQRRLQRVLKDMKLGDRRPSELFNDMKRAAGTTLSDSILHDLWVSRLPPYVQAAIIATNVAIVEKLKIADSITETIGMRDSQVHEVSAVSEVSDLKLEIAELTKQVHKLLNDKERRVHSRSRSRWRGGRPFMAKSNSNLCWYHVKFGEKATKCREPCSFSSSKKST